MSLTTFIEIKNFINFKIMEKKKISSFKKEMEKKISIINRWNYEYYILDDPTVDDFTYDNLLNELKQLEKLHNFTFPGSPTQKINLELESKNSPFKLVERKVPMLSIDSVNSKKDLFKFDKRLKKILFKDPIGYVCELKIDGISASLIYKENKISQITTRGDGFIGEDVTFNKPYNQTFIIRTRN